jgi:hypothetical protein
MTHKNHGMKIMMIITTIIVNDLSLSKYFRALLGSSYILALG